MSEHEPNPPDRALTDAQILLNGRHATLRKGTATLEMEIVSPKDAEFDTVSTMPSRNIRKPEYRHAKARRKAEEKITSVSIDVEFRWVETVGARERGN